MFFSLTIFLVLNEVNYEHCNCAFFSSVKSAKCCTTIDLPPFFVHFYITHHIYSLIFSCWYDQVVLSNFMRVAVYVIVEWKNETRNREIFFRPFCNCTDFFNSPESIVDRMVPMYFFNHYLF